MQFPQLQADTVLKWLSLLVTSQCTGNQIQTPRSIVTSLPIVGRVTMC